MRRVTFLRVYVLVATSSSPAFDECFSRAVPTLQSLSLARTRDPIYPSIKFVQPFPLVPSIPLYGSFEHRVVLLHPHRQAQQIKAPWQPVTELKSTICWAAFQQLHYIFSNWSRAAGTQSDGPVDAIQV